MRQIAAAVHHHHHLKGFTLMKYLALPLILVTLFVGCGGSDSTTMPALTGVNDLAWGDTRDAAKAKLSAWEGVQLVSDTTDLEYAGGMYLGYAVDSWVLSFLEEGGFWSAKVVFAVDSAGSVASGLETKLTDLYGRPAEARVWTFAVAGQTSQNSVTIVAMEGMPVELLYSGQGYRDSVQVPVEPAATDAGE
jgi:hypothetical protein